MAAEAGERSKDMGGSKGMANDVRPYLDLIDALRSLGLEQDLPIPDSARADAQILAGGLELISLEDLWSEDPYLVHACAPLPHVTPLTPITAETHAEAAFFGQS